MGATEKPLFPFWPLHIIRWSNQKHQYQVAPEMNRILLQCSRRTDQEGESRQLVVPFLPTRLKPCITQPGLASPFPGGLTHSLQMVSNQHTVFVTLHPRLERRQHICGLTAWLELEEAVSSAYWPFFEDCLPPDPVIGRLMLPRTPLPDDVHVLISRTSECICYMVKGN